VISHFHGPGYGQGALPPGRYRLEVVVVTIQAPDYIEGHHGGTFGFTVGPPPPPPPVVPKYSLTGKFGSRRGGLLNLPLVGATPCPSHTVMSGPGGKAVPAPTTPPNRSQAQPANPLGCIPVVNGLQINQSAVAKNGTFILPAKVLQQPLPASVNWLSVPNATPLFQAQTSFAFKGPQKNAKLRASAWTTQAGRAAPDFTWCPGNPECAKITEGTKPAIVKYTAGPNRFGTTMQMVISAGPNPSRLVQAVGGGAGPVTFHPLPTGAPVTGAGYAFQQTDPAVNGSGWALHKSTAMGRISMGTGYLGPRPGNEVVNYGFPFTTGRVLVRRTGTQLGNPWSRRPRLSAPTTRRRWARATCRWSRAQSRSRRSAGRRSRSRRCRCRSPARSRSSSQWLPRCSRSRRGARAGEVPETRKGGMNPAPIV
jgi:hypothetical protein